MINIFSHSVFKSSLRFPAISCNTGMEVSRLMRDGTAEPVLRDQILRRGRGPGQHIHFTCSAETTCRVAQGWRPYTRLIHTLAICVTNMKAFSATTYARHSVSSDHNMFQSSRTLRHKPDGSIFCMILSNSPISSK